MPHSAIEFYSGIGGLHFALSQSGVDAQVVKAYDWDTLACNVYSINHGSGLVQQQDISKLSASDLAVHRASLWLLSPSCQPYTNLNPNKKESQDPRAASFLHLMNTVLPDLTATSHQPKYILMENVTGFKDSDTRLLVIERLQAIGYCTAEFLLSPLQYGIPNSRLRYYLLATISSPTSSRSVDSTTDRLMLSRIPGDVDMHSTLPLSHYLDDIDSLPANITVPDRILERWGAVFDIVLPSSTRSCCFTRGYTQMIQGAGSILQMEESVDTIKAFLDYASTRDISFLHQLKLRYFTPSEILRLSHFTTPSSSNFKWPQGISEKSKYRLLGNSVNVCVISMLIRFLLVDK